jgi:hypothetical protein
MGRLPSDVAYLGTELLDIWLVQICGVRHPIDRSWCRGRQLVEPGFGRGPDRRSETRPGLEDPCVSPVKDPSG